MNESAPDYMQVQIDLNEVLVKDKAATYIFTVAGDSMIGAGIADGDEITVDTSMAPYPGKIAVASIDSEYTVKRFTIDKRGQGWLMPENPDYPPLRIEGVGVLHFWRGGEVLTSPRQIRARV